MPLVIDETEASRQGANTSVLKNRIWTIRGTLTRAYYVVSDADDPNQTEAEILATPGIPPIASIIQGAYCISQKADEQSQVRWYDNTARTLWMVTCEFDTDRDVGDIEQPPEARTPEVDWSIAMESEDMPYDIDGVYVANSVGDRINVQVQRPSSILEIRRYEQYPFDPNVLLFYGGMINSAPFYGAPIGSVFMEAIQSQKTQVDAVLYSSTTYRMKFRLRYDENGNMFPDSWNVITPNVGENYFDTPGDSDTKTRITDKEKGARADWLELDGSISPKTATFPVQLTFKPYFYRDFNALNLGPY